MKIDFKGIRYNIWLYFMLFALCILALLGMLQTSMIKPYYRNSKISDIENVASQIQSVIIDNETIVQDNADDMFKLSINNDVCMVIYNEYNQLVYKQDSLGSSCIFNQPLTLNEKNYHSIYSGNSLHSFIGDNNDIVSEMIVNPISNQSMILYGSNIKSNLASYTLYINSPIELLDSTLDIFKTQFVVLSFALIIFSIVLSLFLSKKIANPILKMRTPAKELAVGNYDIEFEEKSFTEINELANTLNDATEKLSKVEELRKDLIANVSHDIKTPLTMIKAYAEMVKDISGDNKEKREKHLDVIINEVDYLDHLVNDMSKLSKFQSGNFTLDVSQFNIYEKCQNIISLCDHLLLSKNMKCELQGIDSLVSADEVKIGQVIYNFLTNAIKHSDNDTVIVINVEHGIGKVIVSVQDNGSGIKEEDLPYIWDRYYKIDKGFSRSVNGSGLGLAIVKAILDAHNAQYGVESIHMKGSKFYFELIVEDVD